MNKQTHKILKNLTKLSTSEATSAYFRVLEVLMLSAKNQIDEMPPDEFIDRVYKSQLQITDGEAHKHILFGFDGDKSPDFYKGILAACNHLMNATDHLSKEELYIAMMELHGGSIRILKEGKKEEVVNG